MNTSRAAIHIEEIRAAYEELRRRFDSGEIAAVERVHDKLRTLCAAIRTPAEQEQILQYFRHNGLIRGIREASGAVYGLLEEARYNSLPPRFSIETLISDDAYLSEMLQLSLKEYMLGDLGSGRARLFIGAGALPLTPLAWQLFDIAKQEGVLDRLNTLAGAYPAAHIPPEAAAIVRELAGKLHLPLERPDTLCLERQESAALKGCAFLDALGLRNINLIHADARSFEFPGNLDRISCAGVVAHKLEILSRILSSHDKRGQVLMTLRLIRPGSLGELLYEPFTGTDAGRLSAEFEHFRCRGEYPPDGSAEIFATTGVYTLGVEQR